MAIMRSTGYLNLIMGKKPTISANGTIYFSASGTIKSASLDFFDYGFRPGDWVKSTGNVVTANATIYEISSINSAGGTMTVTPTPTNESAGGTISLVGSGKPVIDIFRNCVMVGYPGTIPDTADDAETSLPAVVFTKDANEFVRGQTSSALTMTVTTDAIASKVSGDTWRGIASFDTTLTHLRIYDNAYKTGDISSNDFAARIQGSIGYAGADFEIEGGTAVKAGRPCEIWSFTFQALPTD